MKFEFTAEETKILYEALKTAGNEKLLIKLEEQIIKNLKETYKK